MHIEAKYFTNKELQTQSLICNKLKPKMVIQANLELKFHEGSSILDLKKNYKHINPKLTSNQLFTILPQHEKNIIKKNIINKNNKPLTSFRFATKITPNLDAIATRHNLSMFSANMFSGKIDSVSAVNLRSWK